MEPGLHPGQKTQQPSETSEGRRFISCQQAPRRVTSQGLSPKHEQRGSLYTFTSVSVPLLWPWPAGQGKTWNGPRPGLGFPCWTGRLPQNPDFPYYSPLGAPLNTWFRRHHLHHLQGNRESGAAGVWSWQSEQCGPGKGIKNTRTKCYDEEGADEEEAPREPLSSSDNARLCPPAWSGRLKAVGRNNTPGSRRPGLTGLRKTIVKCT